MERASARVVVLVAVLAALVSPAAASAADGHKDPQAILEAVNAKRAAQGIPPLVLDAKMTQGCRNHVDYSFLNQTSGEFHDETPGNPGYTELGQLAARNSIGGYGFADELKPYRSAPAHRVTDFDPIGERVGIAERTTDGTTIGCLWTSVYTDGDGRPGRRVAAEPRGYTVPGSGTTNQWNFEVGFEGPTVTAFDVGFTTDPHALFATGQHVFLYHDDLPQGALYFACRGVLLGPGGLPVEAPLLRHRMLVPRVPFLPGGTYRALATHSPTERCGALQRTTDSSFTTQPREDITTMLDIGEAYTSAGRWLVPLSVHPHLRYMGRGEMDETFVNSFGTFTNDFDTSWPNAVAPFDITDMPEGTYTLRAKNDRVDIGPDCYSSREVKRTITKSGSSFSSGPLQVTSTPDDPCEKPPAAAAPAPLSGPPGTVVRIAGAGVKHAIAVRFGGVPATAWRVDGEALEVTVPAGAASGPLTVRTPTGESTATASFTVPSSDTAPPDTRVDLGPGASGESSTVHVAFSTTEGGGTATCSLDGAAPAPCTSPYVAEGLGLGTHVLRVSAVDAAGNVDRTPAETVWTVGNDPTPVPPPPGQPPLQGGTPPENGNGTPPEKPEPVRQAAGKLTRSFSVRGRRTRVRSLRIASVAAGSRIVVACAPARRLGCPRRSTTQRIRRAAASVDLSASLRNRVLAPGARISITVTAKGRKTRRYVLTVRNGRPPALKG